MALAPILDAAATETLRAIVTGGVTLPGEGSYDAARAVWNGMIDRRPAAVVRPMSAAEVAAAIGFARERDLPVAVRSGGHSIPGYSTCDDGLLIDLAAMRGVRVDPSARTAQVRGGSLLGELDEAVQEHGLVCPVGVVSHTGVAGLTLGGGMGRLQRRFGLTIDSLTAVELVTADGRLVRASEEEEPELFWGMRGAGANFGIATAFEYRLHPLDPRVTRGRAIFPMERIAEVVPVFRGLEETGPDELLVTLAIGVAGPSGDFPPEVAGRPMVSVAVFHSGSEDAAGRDVAPLLALGPVADSIQATTYLQAQRLDDEAMGWGHRYYMRSGFMPGLPDAAVEAMVEGMLAAPRGGECAFSVWAWRRAIARVPDEATAFTGRDAAFWVAVDAMWEDPALDDRYLAWGRTAMAGIEPFLGRGRYVNDVAESGEDVVRSVYGDRKHDRLVALKRIWDPDNVFRLNQNIRP